MTTWKIPEGPCENGTDVEVQLEVILAQNRITPKSLAGIAKHLFKTKSQLDYVHRRRRTINKSIVNSAKLCRMMRSNQELMRKQIAGDKVAIAKVTEDTEKLQIEYSTLLERFLAVESDPSKNHLIQREMEIEKEMKLRNASENPNSSNLELVLEKKLKDKNELEKELTLLNRRLKTLKDEMERFRVPKPISEMNESDQVTGNITVRFLEN